MSEPTYRVEISHRPQNGDTTQWCAGLYRVADDWYVRGFYHSDPEKAFDQAQEYVRRLSLPVLAEKRDVFLSEDGDILDPHEVQR